MFKTNLALALNNFIHRKLYSAINIIGLAVGISVFILIRLFVLNEYSYDKHWDNYEQITRVNYTRAFDPNLPDEGSDTSMMVLPALLETFLNEIEDGTRIMSTFGSSIEVDNNTLNFKTSYVDPSIVNLFDFEVLLGDLNNTFADTNSIALSESSAQRIFGNANPIGELIQFSNLLHKDVENYKVTAVYRLAPGNTILRLPSLVLLDEISLLNANPQRVDWDYSDSTTFIKLNSNIDIEDINSKLADFVEKNASLEFFNSGIEQSINDIFQLKLQKINEIYFNGPYPYLEDIVAGNILTTNIFNGISVLILLIATINFIILSTANSSDRACEVAIRKVVGAKRDQLIIQFLLESFLLTFISLLLALGLVELCLPFFETLCNRQLNLPYTSASTYLSLTILLFSISFLGGLYPSLLLSKYKPSFIFTLINSPSSAESMNIRTFLIITQFTISIVLIISTMVIYSQLSYSHKLDPGFNKDNLMVIALGGIFKPEIQPYSNTLKQEISALTNVSSATLSTLQPTPLYGGMDVYTYLSPILSNTNINSPFYPVFVDYQFLDTYEIPLLSGRNFDVNKDNEELFNNSDSTSTYNIILSLEASKQLGFALPEEAIGSIIFSGSSEDASYQEYTVIGVTRDSQFKDLRAKVAPTVYNLSPDQAFWLTLRYQGDSQIVISQIKQIWSSVLGNEVININFVEDSLNQAFNQEQNQAKIIISFSCLAIFIACLGLYGSTTFILKSRTKEIAIRKIMGATTSEIINLYIWQFFKPILVASFIAWPLSIILMMNWLQRFPYQMPLWFLAPIFIIACLIAFTIAWTTIIKKITLISKGSPIHAIRYD